MTRPRTRLQRPNPPPRPNRRLNLNRRLNVEFYGGFGAVYFKQKQYYKNDNIEDYTDGTAQANANGYKLLPIKIGVSISYIFK